jgi:hypothetical protein
MSVILDRQLSRWYKLIDHPVQLALMDAVARGVRFPVVPAGRRSGKTERFKRFLAKEAMKIENSGGLYFAAAPTYAQAKLIFWDDLKKLTLSSTHSRRPSESEHIIFMPNGSEIHLIGLDRPQRFEGPPWTGGGIDEIGNIKSDAWEANIMPALNTVNPTNPNYRAFCWLFGVPEGLNHYYDMAQYAENANDSEWELFHWKSSDILPVDVIESAKRQMSPRQYRQEYEASFETASGRIYEDYSPLNYTSESILPHEQLLWYHDFNYTPMSSGIGVIRDKSVYLLEEIILTSAVARQSAMEFVERYKNHENKHAIIYGDPAGRAGEKHGHASDYTEMEDVLRDNGWKFTRRVRPKSPAIKDRQNAVRAKILNAAGDVSLYVNVNTAPYTHKGLATVQLKSGSTFIEEDSDYQHITTAVGYMVYHEWPIKRQSTTIPLGEII